MTGQENVHSGSRMPGHNATYAGDRTGGQGVVQPNELTEQAAESQEDNSVKERYPFTLMNGMKTYMIRGNKFELPERYIVTARLGQGSYGMVVQALDKHTGTNVAIKKCGSVFKHPEDGKRILREIKLMQLMNHRNILPILDVLPPVSRNFEEVYMVLPCLDTDLSNIIRSQKLSEGHCKYIIYQILRGLKYIHSANVLHRDLKPANILINFDCRIKICDFGLARGADPTRKQNLTNYVVTRWYRAPELLLDNTRYNSAIDIWSTGCIFAEMLRGSALFPGESSLDQMHRVADALTIPQDDDLWWIQSAKAREYLKLRSGKENRVPSKELRNLIPADTKPLANDFLKHMLAFNPYKRWSADWLLDHPYLADCHRPDSCTRATTTFKWRWDSDYPDAEVLRQLFWQEMVSFHPEIEQSPGGSLAPQSCLSPVKEVSATPLPEAAIMPLDGDGNEKCIAVKGETIVKYETVKVVEMRGAVATIRERPTNVVRADEKVNQKGVHDIYHPMGCNADRMDSRHILQHV